MFRARVTLIALALLTATSLACHEIHFEPKLEKGEIGIYDDLFSVSVQDDDHVVAAGYWGSIYVSENGGKSWVKADTGTNQLIYDVSMAEDGKGWAVGQLGLVLRTEDGGLTWKSQENPKVDQGVHLFSVQALDGNRAWAVGEWGTRIYTDDGGATWQDHSLTIDEKHPQFVWLSLPEQDKVRAGEKVFEDVGLNDVYCLGEDTNYCWMIGEFGYVFYTEDGGIAPDGSVDWRRGKIIGGYDVPFIELDFNEIEIDDEDRGKVRALSEQILDQQHLNIAIQPRVSQAEMEKFGSSEDPFPIFEIVEARTQEVQAVAEGAGILSDRIRRRGAPPWDYEDFLEDDPDFLDRWKRGRLSEAPGIEVEIAQNPYLFTIRFSDTLHGLISGLGGVILKTEDGGRSWHYEDIGRKQAIFSVLPFDSKRAMVVGEKGLMRTSDDGGVTWKQPAIGFPTIFTFMRDVSFERDGRVGYIVGQRGLVLRTEDGGETWKQVLPPQGKKAQEEEVAAADQRNV
jgi:photosystem II stability/assembly factor-like uncharacterized protein